VLADECFLLVRVGLPQKAGDLVVADADPPEQVLDAAGLVGDAEGVLDPLTDLVGVAEAAGGDLFLETLDLTGGELAGVALVVEGAEGSESLVAIDPKPFAQLRVTDPQEFGDLRPGLARGDRQDGGQPLVDSPVEAPLSPPLDLTTLLGGKDYRLHDHNHKSRAGGNRP
jgi:hypothetical protein